MSEIDDSSGAGHTEIERLEQQEARAMLGADVSTLQKLWADDLIVNSTANLIAGKQILLEMIKNGLLRLRSYERHLVRIVPSGDIVVTTGNEVSQLITNAAEYKMFVSYMNVWMRRAENWQLVARHVGMIQRERPQP